MTWSPVQSPLCPVQCKTPVSLTTVTGCGLGAVPQGPSISGEVQRGRGAACEVGAWPVRGGGGGGGFFDYFCALSRRVKMSWMDLARRNAKKWRLLESLFAKTQHLLLNLDIQQHL